MAKRFNTTGACLPARHYMVDLTSRLNAIKEMIDNGDYFTINRGRQYGKTTTLLSLVTWLKSDYEVVFLDFQRMSSVAYENEATFVDGFLRVLLMSVRKFPEGIREQFLSLRKETAENRTLAALFEAFVYWCADSERPVVLMIDEVDTATNNQVFLDFLAQIRAAYLTRDIIPTFQSVILAGVHDVRNIKRKIRPDDESKVNSPWITREGNEENASLLAFDDCPRDQMELAPFDIAADYLVNMSFQMDDIASMLTQYEEDYYTGMDIKK